MRQKLVAVIGAADPSDSELELARQVGRGLGQRGIGVVTGGLSGVMEAASAGATEVGAMVVGILPMNDPRCSNDHVTISIATGMGDARNAVIANTADAFIAVGGGFGTLSEIAFALKRDKLVVTLSSWNLDQERMGKARLRIADSPDQAIMWVAQELGR